MKTYTPFAAPPSDFKCVFDTVSSHDAFYRFLQNVYRLYPEDRFHLLIKESTESLPDDESIYRNIQRKLPGIKPFLAELSYALPSLFKQKKVIADQTMELLEGRTRINGYVEIGSTGRYISQLCKQISVSGGITLVNDLEPSYSPVDIAERGGLKKIGEWLPLDNYAPMLSLAPGQADLVTCYIGLHHCPLDRLNCFVASIAAALRVGGVFILRDHDVTSMEMNAFVGLAHAVFNAGLNVPWQTNAEELRFFRPIEQWVSLLADHGLRALPKRLLQAHDPSDNVLLAFVKEGA